MKYRSTMNACFTGYIVQAIVNNFVPLLFVTFQNSWHIPLSRITMLITVNFIIQLSVDLDLAGDLGCTAGPTLAGMISSAAGDSLRPGVVAAVIFPVMFLFAAVFLDNRRKEK